jgi:hypothetical protein
MTVLYFIRTALGGESANEPALACAAKTTVPASAIAATITTSANALLPVFFAVVYTPPPQAESIEHNITP